MVKNWFGGSGCRVGCRQIYERCDSIMDAPDNSKLVTPVRRYGLFTGVLALQPYPCTNGAPRYRCHADVDGKGNQPSACRMFNSRPQRFAANGDVMNDGKKGEKLPPPFFFPFSQIIPPAFCKVLRYSTYYMNSRSPQY